MRSVGLRRAGIYGAVAGASFGCALLVAAQTAAQYPQNRIYTYPTTPTYTSPTYTPPGTPAAPSAGSSGGKTVTITGTSPSDYSFQPRKLKVRAGGHVSWSWQSNAPHNVTFTKSGKHSQTGQAETFQLRFKHGGVFHYFCSIHGFTGKIVVRK